MTVRLHDPPATDGHAVAAHARWTRRDTVALATVVLVGAVLRLVRVTRPGGVFDEGHYTHDACWYVHASSSLCRAAGETNLQHPPGGKWLIGLGIKVFGYNPGGWRVAALAAGTLSIALLYLLARKLFGSTWTATLASALLSVDFLHFVHSRIAMLDVFVTFFVVATFLCHVHDRETTAADGWAGEKRGLQRLGRDRWRVAAGLAAGAGVAVKWSAVPALVAVVALTLCAEFSRRKADGQGAPLRRTLREEWTSIILCFVVVPTLVYLASYAGRLEGAFWTWPWTEGSWLRQWAGRQGEMLSFHRSVGELGEENPYTSPAWSWPLLKRPVTYSFEVVDNRYRLIVALGSPLVWWTGLVGLAMAAWAWLRRRSGGTEAVILAGFAAGWAPWLLASSTRNYMFLFYFLPAVPFLCLAVGYALGRPRGRRIESVTTGAFLAGALILFGVYYPILTAVPISPRSWDARVLFDDCERHPEPAAGRRRDSDWGQEGRSTPFLRPGPPPRGWCWR